jgi:hypothetical protein
MLLVKPMGLVNNWRNNTEGRITGSIALEEGEKAIATLRLRKDSLIR